MPRSHSSSPTSKDDFPMGLDSPSAHGSQTSTAGSETNSHAETTIDVPATKYKSPSKQASSNAVEVASSRTTIRQRKRDKIAAYFTNRPVVRFLLHGAGLKLISSEAGYKGAYGEELPKLVLFKSKLLAYASLITHLLPTCITIFLIGFNASVFVNGPPIVTLAQYALQGASKLHELTIVASLAKVISDIVRHKMIHDGIDFGMLSSPFTFAGLNFLWSQEMWSTLRAACRLKSRRDCLFVLLLVGCCVIAGVAGPASALLCLPSAAWLSAGSTEFYIIGNEDQLWPQHLTQEHTGPQECNTPDGGKFYCLQGGWDILNGFVTPEGTTRRTVNIVDAFTARSMWLWRPIDDGPLGTDSWASTPHGATAYLADHSNEDHDYAWHFAKGHELRLRDAANTGLYARVGGKIPIVRVSCSPFKQVDKSSPELLFPVLDSEKTWRTLKSVGPSKELRMNGTYDSRVNATWISLTPEFGTSTAGLAFVTTNSTVSAGCGCSFDARWATGQIQLHGRSKFWQAYVGEPSLPDAVKFPDPQWRPFFDPEIKKYLGASITADINWIEQLSAGIAFQDSTTNFTAVETLLLSTRLWDVPWVLSDKANPIYELEAVLSAYFVNALSRIGWDPQRNPAKQEINPILLRETQPRIRSSDTLLHKNGKIWQRPSDMSTQALKQEWFNYATAWQINDPFLYISVVVLSLHLVIVAVHSFVVIRSKRASESWNSISELIALAYKTNPEPDTLKNCGAGIMLKETLRQKMKVVVVDDDNDGAQKVQLVPWDSKASCGSPVDLHSADVKVGREYG